MNKECKTTKQNYLWLSTASFIIVILFVITMAFNIGYRFSPYLPTECPDYISNEAVWDLGKEALLMFGLFSLILITSGLIYSILPIKIKDWLWSFIDRNLKFAFIIVWILGFLTYCVGTYVPSPNASFFWHSFSVIPMSIIHATEMFIGQSDISAIHTDRHENAFFMLFFNLSHLLAILCSMIFVLHQFGFYLAEEAKVGLSSMLAKIGLKRPKNLYIFWGISEASLILAEDMMKQTKDGKLNRKNTSIVFVRTFDDEEFYSSSVGFKRVFSMIKMKNREIDTLRHLHCRVTTSFHRLSKLMHVKSNFPILSHTLNLTPLDRLIRNATGEVHFLILNDDEDVNIRCTENLQKDSTIKYMIEQGHDIHLYCHAHHSAKTRGLEIKDICEYGNCLHIHIIDSSRLSVFWLKDKVEYHPVNFVSIDKETATVNSPFRASIIGFGETGQEVFNFLYEFGAFVDADGNKTPFHCSIIDDNADKIKGLFLAKIPSLPDHEYKFYNYSIDSTVYWNTMKTEVKNGLCNLFIAISDEELAIDAAVNFCNLAVRWIANNEKRINVYIRSYRHENIERLEAIRDELNGKFSAINIVVFGNIHDLFTYDIIINDHYMRKAKKYNYAYSTGKVVSSSISDTELEEQWGKELKFANAKGTAPQIWDVENIERRRDQNISNAMHAATKMYLLTAATTERDKEYWANQNLDREANTPHYLYISNTDADILQNVAKCEHQRWIAASILQGQTLADAHEKDVQHKKHTDLVSWNEIRKWDRDEQLKTQAYDCAVVDTTIKLSKNK